MIEKPVSRQRYLLIAVVIVAFSSGAACGLIATAAIAAREVRVAVGGARFAFVEEQTQRFALAWKASDVNAALLHAECAYEAQFGEGARWFEPLAHRFSVWQEAFDEGARTAAAFPPSQAIAHSRIGVVLERLGRASEAQEHLAQATKLGGRDPAWWRGAALRLMAAQGSSQPAGSVRP